MNVTSKRNRFLGGCLGLLWLATTCALDAADFPAPYNSEPDRSHPVSAAESAAKLKVPPGFNVSVFAAEPDIQNPIAMAWDGRGRLWIAENYTYAGGGKKFDLNLRDRIIILEDRDGDGRFDSRKVFSDELQMLTSVEVGVGGVWAMCPPQVLFIPDRDGNDVPDGAPEVVLDGFAIPPENYHNFANGLRFGPDGWLYGRCGASSPGELGVPGTPANERIPMRGTIWRYHPKRKIVEAVSSGTTNPWGHDWDEHGELFFINTVNGHLWHHFAGAHFMRPHTIDPNPRVYSQIEHHADHWHFDTAEGWGKSRDGRADSYGGGHAHVGMMIYLGDNWPKQYRGHLFTWNMHGRRVNQEVLERNGSGYVGHHGTDFCVTDDRWFRGMELSYGPDGGVILLDWSDTGECHESTGVHRTSGRIYKINYGQPAQRATRDLSTLAVAELIRLHGHANEWFARKARIELVTRAMSGTELSSAAKQLRELFDKSTDVVVKLRALWSLYSIGSADERYLMGLLRHPSEHIRVWAIRLLSDHWPIDTVMSQRPANRPDEETTESAGERERILPPLIRLAQTDNSALVRLALASTLQRLPISQRARLASALMARKEDALDHNLPLLIWYGLIPLAEKDLRSLASLAEQCELPLTRKYIARRLSEEIETVPSAINFLLTFASKKSLPFQSDVIEGMSEGLLGWRKAQKPAAWDDFARTLAASSDDRIRTASRDLNVVFGDGRALDEVKKIALDSNADMNSRKVALQSLIANRPSDLRSICEQLLDVRFLNPIAARGLAQFADAAVGAKLVKAYRQFHPSERAQLVAMLVSRPAFAMALLQAIAEGKIPRAEISAFHARQIRSLKDDALNKRLEEVWGQFRESTADKEQLIAKWKTQLSSPLLAKADKSRGRILFNQICASCHTMYGEGGKLGPDLTGAGRENLDYLLENVIDPSALVTADFRMSVLTLKDGRTFNGLVTAQTDRTLTLRTVTETLTFERKEVAGLAQESGLSLMPDGLLDGLTPEQARDLIAYLMHKSQVPLPIATQ